MEITKVILAVVRKIGRNEGDDGGVEKGKVGGNMLVVVLVEGRK